MNLETKWLNDFVMLANTRSFSVAAKMRFVTQPAFSRRIRALEQAVGTELIDRSITPIRLTAEGELFIVTARVLVERLDDGVRQLHDVEPEAGTLHIAAAHSLALAFYPQWARQHQASFPNMPVSLNTMHVGQALASVKAHRHDLAMVYRHPQRALLDEGALAGIVIGKTRLVPVSLPKHNGRALFHLGGRDVLPLLEYSDGALLGDIVQKCLPESEQAIEPVYDMPEAEGLKAMVQQGMGVAWVPALCIQDELDCGELVIAGGSRWHILLDIMLYRDPQRQLPEVDALWNALDQYKKTHTP